MRYLLYICLLFSFSCGTSKRSTELESHKTTNVALSDSLLCRDSLLSLEQLLSSERLQAHIMVTEWSRPDSTGKQYPVKTTEVNIDKDKTEQSVKFEQSGSATVQVKKEDGSQVESEKMKENIKTDTRLIPAWIWWFLLVGGLILALLYWLVRRKR